MAQNQTKDTVQSIVDKGKDLAQKGNQRHIIIRNKDGKKLAEFSMTIAVIVGALLFFSAWGVPLIIVGAIYGIVAKLRVEVVRDLAEDENIIEVKLDD